MGIMLRYLLLIAVLCDFSDAKRRIAGGVWLRDRKYPWLVTLGTVRRGWVPNCGGSIITPSHVLTAGHCFNTRVGVSKRGVLVGAYSISRPDKSQVKRITEVIVHEDFVPYADDIAIVVLLEPLTLSDDIQAICLPSPNFDVTGQKVIITGHGAEVEQQDMTETPKEMTTNAISMDVCVEHYGKTNKMSPAGQICTWSEGESACHGDSGGPVMWFNPDTSKYVLVGLVSFGGSCVHRVKPIVQTKVSGYIGWIESKIGNQFCTGT